MAGRHQPENGADSPEGLAAMNGEDPPMIELPRPTRAMVETAVRNMMPDADKAAVMHEVSMVLMADAMGRAIHVLRGPGQLLDIPRCVRANKAGQVEPIPYGYDDERGPDGYQCDCEQIALNITRMIAALEAASAPAMIVPERDVPGLS